MNKLEKNQRYTLLKFDSSINNLSIIDNKILKRQHKEALNKKGIVFDKNNTESFFLYNWGLIDDTEQVNVGAGNNQYSLKIKKATAFCEYSTRKIRDRNGNLLPKKDRLNTQQTDVVFIEKNKEVYIVVYTLDGYEIKRVKKLLCEENLGTLPLQYQVGSEIFTWLCYKYISEKSKLNDYITVQGINGFKGNVLTEENRFTGESFTITELVITKAFLANRYSITAIKIDLDVESATTMFYINEIQDKKELRVMALKGSTTNILMTPVDILKLMPIYIYFYLIPEIYHIYLAEKETFENNDKDPFLSKLGIDVIKRIMKKNSLKIDDIK